MKKIVLLVNALIFSTLISFSQSISLSNGDGPIANGQVVVVSGDMFMPMAVYVFVTNNTAADMDVLVKKEEIHLVPNTNNYFCWSQCYPSTVYLSPDPLMIPANSTNSQNFSGDYDAAGNMGVSKVRYTFFKSGQPLDSASVEVWFNAGYVGLDEKLPYGISFSSAYPNPAHSNVNFSYILPADFAKTASVTLMNILGEKVNETLLTEKQGIVQIPVDQMNSGVYFYSLMVDGNAIITRKLVVR